MTTGRWPDLSYNKLLSAAHAGGADWDLRQLIASIMGSIDLDLVAVTIDHDKLKRIKRLFHELTCCYLESGKPRPDNYYHLLQGAQPTDPWYTLSAGIRDNLAAIIERSKQVTNFRSARSGHSAYRAAGSG